MVSVKTSEKRSASATLRVLGRFVSWTTAVDPRRSFYALIQVVLDSVFPVIFVLAIRSALDASIEVYNGAADIGVLALWVGIWVATRIFQELTWAFLRNIITEKLRQELEDALVIRLQEKVRRLRLDVFEKPDFHDILNRARLAAEPGFFLNVLWAMWGIASSLLTAVAIFVMVGRWSPLVLIALLVTTWPEPFVQINQARASFSHQRRQTEKERLKGYLESVASDRRAAGELRVFGIGPMFLRWWNALYWQVENSIFDLERRQRLSRAVLATISAFGLTAGIAYSAWAVATGRLSAGQFAGMMVALQEVKNRAGRLIGDFGMLSTRLLNINDLFTYLDLGPEEPEGDQPVDTISDIQVENVNFSYPQASGFALRDVSFKIRPRERIALVGANGSGKTTLVKLLMGLYQPTSGRILYNGVDLRLSDVSQVREQLSAVFQDHVRYAFTLRENIGYGKIEQVDDLSAVKAAAVKGGADAIAADLPSGYETKLTKQFSGGTELSGGQWQRVAVSRGFMRQAQLIVMDEPTASLDPQAEAEVFRQFAAMASDSTAILVSHRLGSCRLCDRILVLDAGRLVEEGSHEELLAANGEYARMWALQSQWYKDEWEKVI